MAGCSVRVMGETLGGVEQQTLENALFETLALPYPAQEDLILRDVERTFGDLESAVKAHNSGAGGGGGGAAGGGGGAQVYLPPLPLSSFFSSALLSKPPPPLPHIGLSIDGGGESPPPSQEEGGGEEGNDGGSRGGSFSEGNSSAWTELTLETVATLRRRLHAVLLATTAYDRTPPAVSNFNSTAFRECLWNFRSCG